MLPTRLSSFSVNNGVGGLNSMLDSGGGGSSGPSRGRDIIAVILFAPSSPAEVAMSLCSCSSARLWADQDCGGVGSAEVWCGSRWTRRMGISQAVEWAVPFVIFMLMGIVFCSDLGPVAVLHVLIWTVCVDKGVGEWQSVWLQLGEVGSWK